jgi:uncharacterized tellurite resistance protein B-like protein
MEITELSAEVKGHFLRLYQMAMTDGNFSPEEWKMLYSFARERNIPKEDLDKILLNHSGDIAIPEDIETRISYLYDLTLMIWADGVVDENEILSLKKYCRKFEFLEENIDALSDYLIDSVKNGKTKTEVTKELMG